MCVCRRDCLFCLHNALNTRIFSTPTVLGAQWLNAPILNLMVINYKASEESLCNSSCKAHFFVNKTVTLESSHALQLLDSLHAYDALQMSQAAVMHAMIIKLQFLSKKNVLYGTNCKLSSLALQLVPIKLRIGALSHKARPSRGLQPVS